jgi:acyl carrier protein
MANARIEKRIKEIIGEQLDIEDVGIKPESTANDLGADSLDTIEILMAIEENYDLDISDEDAEQWQTVQDIVNYIERFVS